MRVRPQAGNEQPQKGSQVGAAAVLEWVRAQSPELGARIMLGLGQVNGAPGKQELARGRGRKGIYAEEGEP